MGVGIGCIFINFPTKGLKGLDVLETELCNGFILLKFDQNLQN